MREDGKSSQENNPNPFLLQIPATDKGLYKALYKFNTKAELEEYNLPLGKESQMGKEGTEKQPSVIKQDSQLQYYNEDEILEDNEPEDSTLQPKKEVNYRSMVKNLFEKQPDVVNATVEGPVTGSRWVVADRGRHAR